MADDSPLETLLGVTWNRGVARNAFARYATKNREPFLTACDRTEITPEAAERIEAVGEEVRLLVIATDWCGDVVANLPELARPAELSSKIELRIVDRDRHLDLMDRFLTNGGRAIPAVIAYDPGLARHAKRGPRPEPCQSVILENKVKPPEDRIVPMIRAW